MVLPEGITDIGDDAFVGCISLSIINLPSSLKNIGNEAFYGCKIKLMVIPENVESIGESAFEYSSLESIYIPKSVKYIGKGAFLSCRSMQEIAVDSYSPYYCSVDNVLYSKDMKTLIYYPICRAYTKFVIPNGVKTIAERAFHGNYNLKHIVIPDSVERIEAYAFKNCALSTVDMGKCVEYIGTAAFWDIDREARITLPNGLKSISITSFYGTIYYDGTKEEWDKVKVEGDYGFGPPVQVITLKHAKNGFGYVYGRLVIYKSGKRVRKCRLVKLGKKTYAVINGFVRTGKRQIVKVGKRNYITDKNGVVFKPSKKNRYKLIAVRNNRGHFKKYIINKNGVVLKDRQVKFKGSVYKINKNGIATKK